MKSLKSVLMVALSALILLGGCREEVSRTPVGQSTETTGPRSCSKLDICYKCGLNFNGELSCGIKMSAFCPGIQQATVRQTPMRIEFDDGSFQDYVATETLAADACK